MDTEGHHVQESEFTTPTWLEMGAFTATPHNSPPIPDFHGFAYSSSPVMTLEASSYGMSIPPPYASLPLAIPSHPWPSLLTTQPQYSEIAVAPVSMAPALSHTAPLPSSRKSSTSGSTPRRTLTDDDRRRMCLYHEENKTAKQTDIGALFGVERSTVSKVLRQKEKYLNPEDGSRSPIKRPKGRVPDIEKALSNWARNYQRQGYPISDEMIREKALFFASTCGSPDGKEKVLSTTWLEKFKNRNNLMGAKSRKSSSETIKSETGSPIRLNTNTTIDSTAQTPGGGVSPVSTTSLTMSPLSPTRSQEALKKELAEALAEFSPEYTPAHAKSLTSLDMAALSTGVTSPSSTLVSTSPFTPTSQSHIAASNTNRPRSQTFPVASVDPSLITADGSLNTKGALQQSLSLSILESPLEEEDEDHKFPVSSDETTPASIESKMTPMFPPPFLSKSASVSPVSPPESPSQDEARRALELVWNYFQNQPNGLVAQDFMTIGKLMERLALSHSNALPGGFARIEEHNISRVSKKRSIHTLG
ncbi:hypothetical protein ASPZODRAFT_15103 [Penicilliopsis zonata CBS 506.65]|uniref:HTH CENPB-type domain-containing protein n=1 Tax=Penicilliopsis zonata CBS 506.65 TaxID=1073090 RepID=A0A1L9SK88_9EURO|nr:hypothetical protein ASPZODRAFT_15103 [Penicilliopsis zonata CBS 506.65]OJJ47652.1 hypothetical protein ASPZODRAFT_15103 [Penicilliopsis zonata CBS 506.65]